MMTAQIPANSVHPKTRAAWREWLQNNHTRHGGIWVIRYKKSSGQPYLAVDDE
jgi:hypothetical protein